MSCQIKRTENENFYTFIILANDANFICEIANLDKFNAISIDFQASYPWGLLLHFPPLQSAPAFSTLAFSSFSTPAIMPVPHFPFPHFQLPRFATFLDVSPPDDKEVLTVSQITNFQTRPGK